MFAEFEYCEQGAEVAPGPKRPEGCWQASAAAPCPPHRAVAGCRPSLSPLVVAPLAVFCTHVIVTNIPGWSSLPSLGLPCLLHSAAVGPRPVQGPPGLCFSSWWFTQHGEWSQALSPRLGCTPTAYGPCSPVAPRAVLHQCAPNGFSHSRETCTQMGLSAMEKMCALSVLCPMMLEATTAVSQPQVSVLPLLGREGEYMLKLMLTGKEKWEGI